jgi:hypothetical protein
MDESFAVGLVEQQRVAIACDGDEANDLIAAETDDGIVDASLIEPVSPAGG